MAVVCSQVKVAVVWLWRVPFLGSCDLVPILADKRDVIKGPDWAGNFYPILGQDSRHNFPFSGLPVTFDALPHLFLANEDDEDEATAQKIQSVDNLEEVEGESTFFVPMGVKIDNECMGPLQYPEEAQNNEKLHIQCLSRRQMW